MIDRQARLLAADLVRRFRDGELTNDQLEGDWPISHCDHALRAMHSMLWRFYDDHREHTLTGKHAPDDFTRAELTRYAAFLDTELPYSWARTNFSEIGGLGMLVPLSLGLLWPLDYWIKLRSRQREAGMSADGELASWPFTSTADYEAAQNLNVS